MRCGDRRRPDPGPAAAALLRRVDREPRAARPPAARAGLPRLRERDRDGRRPPRDRRARADDEEDRQRADDPGRRPRDPSDQRARRRLLPRPDPGRAAAAGRAARARPRGCGRDRAVDGDAAVPRLRARARAASRCASTASTRSTLAGSCPPAGSTSRRRNGTTGSWRSTSPTRTRCTPASAAAARTSPARSRASTSTSTRCPPVAREAALAAGVGPTCRNPFQSIVVRSVEVLYACDEALRIIADYEPPDEPAVEVAPRAGGRLRGHRGAARHALAPLRDRRRRHDPRRADRAADLAEPARDRAGPAGVRAAHVRLPDDELRHRCEQAIRNYDPCISCATHFLTLDVERRERGHRRRQRGARRRRRRPDRSPAPRRRSSTRAIRWRCSTSGTAPTSVVVIDAVRSGAVAGHDPPLRRRRSRFRRSLRSSTSTHAVGLAEAIELARALGRLPER